MFIKGALLSLGSLANLALDLWIAHHCKMPGLLVGTARRGAGCFDTGFDHLARHWRIRKIAHGAAHIKDVVQRLGARAHFVLGITRIRRQRNGGNRGGHNVVLYVFFLKWRNALLNARAELLDPPIQNLVILRIVHGAVDKMNARL